MEIKEYRLSNYKWSIDKSKDNKDILIINGKYIHSKFSPLKEANDFIFQGKNLIIIFGLGLAYHVNNIIKNNPDSYFIIYEPFSEIFDLSNNYIDGLLFQQNKANICILKEIDNETIFTFISKIFKPEIKIKTYSNLGYKSLFKELEADFFESVKKNFEIVIQNILTESNFIPLWTNNFLLNIKNLDYISLLNPKKNRLDDNIAVITCAGPNLINDIELIKKFRGKITIFTVDTALKVLLTYNIIPDFIISLDGQYYSMDDFVKNISKESTLILDAISYPKISSLHKNIYYTITDNIFEDSIIEYFFKNNNLDKFGIITGGNISDYTASIVIALGFNKIYFAGLDLSYPLLQSHSKFSPFYNRALYLSDFFNSMNSIFIKAISNRNLKSVESKVDGKNLYTDFVMENYAFYFNRFAEYYKSIKFYNSKYNGIKIPNFIEKNLNEIIIESNSKQLKSNDLIDKNDVISISKDKLTDFFNLSLKAIYKRATELDNLFSQTDFNKIDKQKHDKWQSLINDVFKDFPFLKKFILMTVIILQRKNISEDHLIYYKHVGYKTLQSIYFIIRILQKNIKTINS